MNETISIRAETPAIAVIGLNRPQSANALNTAMALALAQTLGQAPKNPDCRVIVLTGEGKHFCAGADLKDRNGMSEKDWHIQHDAFEKALYALLDCPLPVIAAVNGAAMGGGLELALAADFIHASDSAKFALTEASLGIMPGMGGTQTLSRAVGMRRAKELIFKAKPFSAPEALAYGMVNAVHPPEKLMDEVLSLARTLAENAPLSLRAIKKSINEGAGLTLEHALSHELKQYHSLLSSKDRHEGINAYNEKRKARFTGE